MLGKIFTLELIMLLLAVFGVLLWKKKVVTDSGQNCLTNILIDLILPANIFLSFQNAEVTPVMFRNFVIAVLISVLPMLGMAALGMVIYQKVPREARMVYRYGTVNSNAMFIGYPVIQSLFGSEGILQLTIPAYPATGGKP